jgi:hypothetical protein
VADLVVRRLVDGLAVADALLHARHGEGGPR